MKNLLPLLFALAFAPACAQVEDSARLDVFWHPLTTEGAMPEPSDFKGYSVHNVYVFSRLDVFKGYRLARFQVDRFVEAIPDRGFFIVDVTYDGAKQVRLYYHKPEPDRVRAVKKTYLRR